MFMTMRRVVVLPAPFGPSRPKTLPRGTSRERSFTATWPAKAFPIPLRTMALSFMGPPGPRREADGRSVRGAKRHPVEPYERAARGFPGAPCDAGDSILSAVPPSHRDETRG